MSDLISRSKLIMLLNDYALHEAPFKEGDSSDAYDAIMNCITAVEEAPAVGDGDKWVPFPEVHPERDGDYQVKHYEVTKLIDDRLVVTTATYDFGEFNNWLVHKSHKVVAWRELPEPYNPNKKKEM